MNAYGDTNSNSFLRITLRTGFTLIELLLGLAIFSIIALTIYGTFRGGIRISHQSERSNEIFREVRSTFDLLAHELENMTPYDFTNSYPERQAFTGERDRLTFLLATDQGLKAVRYYLKPPDWGKIRKIIIGDVTSRNVAVVTGDHTGERPYYLIREEMDFIDFLNNGDTHTGEIEIIASHIRHDGLRFFYGYTDEDTKTKKYKDEWSGSFIPSSVRISIDFMLPDQSSDQLSIDKDVLIPSGFLGREGFDEVRGHALRRKYL